MLTLALILASVATVAHAAREIARTPDRPRYGYRYSGGDRPGTRTYRKGANGD